MAIMITVIFLVGVLVFAFVNNIAEFIGNHTAGAKHLLLCVVAVAAMFAAFAFLPPARAEVDFYPSSAIVVSFDVSEGVIRLKDGEGNIWKLFWDFSDEVPVEIGDVFSLLMWEAGTPDYRLDDEIIDAVNSRIKAQ